MSKKQYAAIAQYEYGSDISEVFVGTYDECLDWSGEQWESRDLNFDKSRNDPFYVDPNSGYSENVQITKVKDKICYVSHADGAGIIITIAPVISKKK